MKFYVYNYCLFRQGGCYYVTLGGVYYIHLTKEADAGLLNFNYNIASIFCQMLCVGKNLRNEANCT